MIKVINAYSNEKHLIKNKNLLQAKLRIQELLQDTFIQSPEIKKVIRNFYRIEKTGEIPLFHAVEIETVNRCNGVCPFCPVNKNSDTRPFHKMAWSLFQKIIDELRELDYSGNLAIYSNNEPFLDERITEFTKCAREALPNANIYLFTNGTLLTLEKYKEIIPYLDYLHIDNYSDTLELTKPVKEIYEYSRESNEREKAVIYLRKQNEVLTSRGGQAPNKGKTKGLSIPCLLPFQQFIIRPDGKVSLCCNDALGKYTMGNVSQQSMQEIWEGTEFQKIRAKLYKGRRKLLLCNECDTRIGRREFSDGKWAYIIGSQK